MSKLFLFYLFGFVSSTGVNSYQYDKRCQTYYDNKMLELHNRHRSSRGLDPLILDVSLTHNAFMVIDAKLRNDVEFFKTNPYYWNIFGQKLSNFNVSCSDIGIIDYNDKILSGKKHHMSSQNILFMSCAARLETKYTTTACVYADYSNKVRVWKTNDPRHPNWQAVFTEVNEHYWKHTENGKLLGYWKKLDEPKSSVVILGQFEPASGDWMNEKLRYTLAIGVQYINNRLNENNVYEDLVVRGNWV